VVTFLPGALTRGADNPILTNVGGTYDDLKCGPHSVTKVGEGDYRMWYEGVEDVVGTDEQNTVCYATSTDGENWTKYGSNPVASGGVAWENNEMCPTTVIRVSSSDYRMWYHGGNNSGTRRIGYATSSDGLSWTKNAGNPILTVGAGGAWDETAVVEPKVVRVSSSDYRMWYRGWNASNLYQIGYATSSDGITWSKHGSNPVFSPGAGGQWDDGPLYAFVPYMGSATEFHAWYVDGESFAAGYAYSTDGITWTRGANNPVLSNLGGANIYDPTDSVGFYKDGSYFRVTWGAYDLNIGQRGISQSMLIPDQTGVAAWVST
jgi:sucrose-6-phosphate hydrolase SacC (GH32 family)